MAEVYVFDMDHTLIDSDCDVTWKAFLVRHGYAPQSDLALADRYYDDYLAGTLDAEEFTRFQLREVIGKTPEELAPWTEAHFREFAEPKFYASARTLLAELHRMRKPTVLLTSTGREIAAPLARELGIPDVLGTPWERDENGRFTGRLETFSYVGEGKVAVAREYCRTHGWKLEDLAYFGDGTSDIPILSAVGSPHAVNPTDRLRQTAEEHHWPILRFV